MPFPFSIPYPTSCHPSAYGPQTANTNFCERDYQFSPYIAELINTLSNIVYLVYALHGILLLHARNRLSLTTALPHLGLVAVGLGSAAYHASLLKLPQLADEIGMAIPTGAVVSRLLSFQVRDKRKGALVYWGSVAVITAVYVVHCVSFTNWIHYPAFGGMVFFVGRRCITLIRRIEDVEVRKKVRSETKRGEVLFLGAFAVWIVDRVCCEQLTRLRGWVDLPWGWLTELHGWWHIGTGLGAFVFIQVAEFLTEDDGKGDPGDRLSPFAVRLWGYQEGRGNIKVHKKAGMNGHTEREEKKSR